MVTEDVTGESVFESRVTQLLAEMGDLQAMDRRATWDTALGDAQVTQPKLREVLRLPTSTGEADAGPILEYRPDQLWVSYDAEDSNGSTVWTTVRFREAIAIKFTPDQGCAGILIEAYSRVCEFETSNWKKEIVETNPHYDLPASTRHFVLYFDHHGCLEVLADDVGIDRPPGQIVRTSLRNS